MNGKYSDLANELRKNMDILESTFEQNNLQLLRYTLRPYSDDDADCVLLIEFASLEKYHSPDGRLTIKANLYDKNDDLYLTSSHNIYLSDFSGYDTVELDLYDNQRTLLNAKSGRIFVTR